VIDCTEGLLEMRRAILADRQQAIRQTIRPFTTHALDAIAAGQPVAVASTRAYGRSVKYKEV
jgi:hypothetical protein